MHEQEADDDGGHAGPVARRSITADARGPVLPQNRQLIEELAHQNREPSPERVMHAKDWSNLKIIAVHDRRGKWTQRLTRAQASAR
jgi:catalase